MIAVARHGTLAAGVMAGFLFLAALVAVGAGEPAVTAFVATAMVTVFFAGAIFLAIRGRAGRLDRLGSYVLLVVLWFGLPVLAAVPVAATTGLGLADAWFEAVCAITTTGAGQIHDLEAVPRATLAWLLSLQWFGGLLTLIGAVAVLAPAGIGGLPDRAARAQELGQSEAAAIENAARQALTIYGGATLLCVLALFAAGVDGFDAFGLASAVLSTGGLLPDADGIAAYGSFSIRLVLIVFMLVGGTSLLWQRMILTRRFRLALAHRESFAVLLACLVVGIVAGAAQFRAGEGGLALPLAIEDGFFTAVSIVTTTGVEPHAGAFSSLPIILVLMLVFIGGASFSTSGGIKMYRAGAMATQALQELGRLIHPHAVRPRRLGGPHIDIQAMKAIWLCFTVTAVLLALIAAAIAPAMPSFEAAYVAALASLANAGPIFAANWTDAAAWPDWGALPIYAKGLLAFAMILGRLEILMVVGLVHFGLWRR